MSEASPVLLFAENGLQIAALAFMGVVYALKIRWILKFPAGVDRQAPAGNSRTSAAKGRLYSLFSIATPWTMVSTRQHLLLYAQFVIFHLGVAASIAMSFLIPYAPGAIAGHGVVLLLQAIFLAAFLVGLVRLGRRLTDPYLRAISSPDDYFAILLLIFWLAVSFFAAPNHPKDDEGILLTYFYLTAFFLVYVPFSKISHYLYYPFSRWYLGKTLGHRGVYPPRRKHEAYP